MCLHFCRSIKTEYLTNNTDSYFWMCLQFNKASDYSYYFYMFSDKEPFLASLRILGGTYSSIVGKVCAASVPVSEFHTLLKIGNENAAKVDCPDPLLGSFNYTYTEKKVTYCANVNTATINACDAATFRTHVIVDNTGCTAKKPFYSTSGQLWCIVSFTPSTVSYTTLYNPDSTVSSKFVCVAAQSSGSSTQLSMIPGECTGTQTPSVSPSDTTGATMELKPYFSCKTTPSTPLFTGCRSILQHRCSRVVEAYCNTAVI
ncbi:uncharacterized protein LOC127849521 [Dreissena polymorpha]|uniref:uncharacterized protein LOC127849521 n=1 Tax=Dreissena polymorpha TaxID=45954 RepID=UPI0022656497|nr:uncharacterized protein LOC127849521 [Dreissena polymorpha]